MRLHVQEVCMAQPIFALCVGSSEGITSAQRVYKALLSSFPLEDIRFLAGPEKATAKRIKGTLRDLTEEAYKKANQKPFLFFHYSGHGTRGDDGPAMDLRDSVSGSETLAIKDLIDTFRAPPRGGEIGAVDILLSLEMCECGSIKQEHLTGLNIAVIAPTKGELYQNILTKALLNQWTYNGKDKEISLADLSYRVSEETKSSIPGRNIELDSKAAGYISVSIPRLTPEPEPPYPSGIGDWEKIYDRPMPEPFIRSDVFNDLKKELSDKSAKNQVIIVNGEGPVGKSTAVKNALLEINKEAGEREQDKVTPIWINCIPGMGKECLLAAIAYGLSKEISGKGNDFIHGLIGKENIPGSKRSKHEWENLIAELMYQFEYYPLSTNKHPAVLVFEDVDNLLNYIDDEPHQSDSPYEKCLTEMEFLEILINTYLQQKRRSRIVLIQQDSSGPCITLPSDNFTSFQIRLYSEQQIKPDQNPEEYSSIIHLFGPQIPIVLRMLHYIRQHDEYSYDKFKHNTSSVSVATCIGLLLGKLKQNKEQMNLLAHIATISNVPEPRSRNKLLLSGPLPINIVQVNERWFETFSAMGLMTYNSETLFMHYNIAKRILDEFSDESKDKLIKLWHKEAVNFYRDLLKEKKHISILYRLKVHYVEAGEGRVMAEILTDREFLETIVSYGYFDLIERWSHELFIKAKRKVPPDHEEIRLLNEGVRMAAMFNGDCQGYRNIIHDMQYQAQHNRDFDIAQLEKAKAEYAIIYHDYRESLRRISKAGGFKKSDILQLGSALTRAWLGFGYPFHPLHILETEEYHMNSSKTQWYLDHYLRGNCYAEMAEHGSSQNKMTDFFRNLLPEHHNNFDARIRGSLVALGTIAEDLHFVRLENHIQKDEIFIRQALAQSRNVKLLLDQIEGQINAAATSLHKNNDGLDITDSRNQITSTRLYFDTLRYNLSKMVSTRLENDSSRYFSLYNALSTFSIVKKLLDIRPIEDLFWKAKYFLTRAELVYEINKLDQDLLVEYSTVVNLMGTPPLHNGEPAQENDNAVMSYIQRALQYLNSNLVKKVFDEQFESVIDRVYELFLMGIYPEIESGPETILFPSRHYKSTFSTKDDFQGLNCVLGKDIWDFRPTIWKMDAPCRDPLLETDILIFLSRVLIDHSKVSVSKEEGQEHLKRASKVLFIAAAISIAWEYHKGLGMVAEIFAGIAPDARSSIQAYNYALKSALWAKSANLVGHRCLLMNQLADQLVETGDQALARDLLTLVKNGISEIEKRDLTNNKLERARSECSRIFKKVPFSSPENETGVIIRLNTRYPVDIDNCLVQADTAVSNRAKKELLYGRILDLSETGTALVIRKDTRKNVPVLNIGQYIHITIPCRKEVIDDEQGLRVKGHILRQWFDFYNGPAATHDKVVFEESVFENELTKSDSYHYGIAVQFEPELTPEEKNRLNIYFE